MSCMAASKSALLQRSALPQRPSSMALYTGPHMSWSAAQEKAQISESTAQLGAKQAADPMFVALQHEWLLHLTPTCHFSHPSSMPFSELQGSLHTPADVHANSISALPTITKLYCNLAAVLAPRTRPSRQHRPLPASHQLQQASRRTHEPWEAAGRRLPPP